jgi:hypothetical protein
VPQHPLHNFVCFRHERQVYAASLQYVRKVAVHHPSQANREAFDEAVLAGCGERAPARAPDDDGAAEGL